MSTQPPTETPTLSKSAMKKAKKLAASILPASLTEDSTAAPSTPPAAPSSTSTFSLTATAPVFTPKKAAAQTATPSDKEYPLGSAGSGVVTKRIRVLQKKVQRVTTYKEIPAETLNADQVTALSNLDKVKATVAELEELKKSIETAELEQASSIRASKAAEDKKVQDKPASTGPLPTILSFIHLHSLVFKSQGLLPDTETPAAVKDLSSQEAAAIGKTWHALVVEKQTGVAEKLAEGKDEEVLEGVSYAKLASILKALDTPSAPLTNGKAASTSSPVAPPTTTAPLPIATPAEDTTKPTSTKSETPLAASLPPAIAASVEKTDVASTPETAGEESSTPAVDAKKDEPPVALTPEPVGVKGLEGEGEGLAEEDDLFAERDEEPEKEEEEEEETLKETEAEKEEAKDEVKPGSLGGAAIAVPKKAAPIDWADDSGSFGSLPPIPSFGGTTQMMATSPLPPKPSTPKKTMHWGAPRPQPTHQQSPTSFPHTSSLNQPNNSYSHRPPPQRREGGFHPPPGKTAAPTVAAVEEDDGFEKVGGKKSKSSDNKFGGGGWRNAGGEEGSSRGGRGGRGRGRGEWRGGEGRGGRGRGGYRGDSGPRGPPPAAPAAAQP